MKRRPLAALAAVFLFCGAAQAQTIQGAVGLAQKALTAARAAVPQSTVGQPKGVAPLDFNSRTPVSNLYNEDIKFHAICGTVTIGALEGNYTIGTTYGETDRRICVAKTNISHLALFLAGKAAYSGSEINSPVATYWRGSIEYPLGHPAAPPLFSLGQQTLMRIDPASSGLQTDPLGVSIPAGASFAVRTSVFLPWAPVPATPTAVAGGSLPASTTEFYKLSCLKGSDESGPSAEVSAATGTSTLSLNVTWTASASPLGCDNVRVYRSTTTGSETYLATVPAPGLNYLDNGANTPVSGIVPQPAGTYPLTERLTSSMQTTQAYSNCTGNQTDQVGNNSTLSLGGPSLCAIFSPAAILADTVGSFPVCGFGDSIQAGTGIQTASSGLGQSPEHANWFAAAMATDNFDYVNISVPSSEISTIISSGQYGASQRLKMLAFCSYIISNFGTNDLYTAVTWQNVALAHVQVAQSEFALGKRYYVTTLTPRVATTDNMLTLANQAPQTYEAARQNYNNWVRNGMQMLSGAPVLSGGTPTPYIAGYFDIAAAVGETNSSGVPTANGGYWPVYPTALLSSTALAGSPTTTNLTVSGTPWTYHQWAGDVALMLTGAAAGKSCVLSDNAPGYLICYTPLSIAPAAGDTFAIYQSQSFDGLHPSLVGHTAAATAFAAWATANLTPF